MIYIIPAKFNLQEYENMTEAFTLDRPKSQFINTSTTYLRIVNNYLFMEIVVIEN